METNLTNRQAYGDARDHGQVTFTFPDRVQGVLAGTTLASPGFRNVFEQFHGSKGTIETSENYWKLIQGGKPEIDERSPRNITVDSLAAFVRLSPKTLRKTPVSAASRAH